MEKLILVGTGGFIGSILRYGVGLFIHRTIEKPWLPYSTFAVNVLGCFLIGFLGSLSETRQLFNPELRLLVFIGFLGGFTTFSAFGYDVFHFIREGQLTASFFHIAIHFTFGLGAVFVGNLAARFI